MCVCVLTPPATAVRFPSLPDMQQRSQTHTAEQSGPGSAYQTGRERDRQLQRAREEDRERGTERARNREGDAVTQGGKEQEMKEKKHLSPSLRHSSFSPLQSACHPAWPSGLQLCSSYKGILLLQAFPAEGGGEGGVGQVGGR